MSNPSSFKWIAWISLSFFYAYQYVVRVFPSIIVPDLLAKFQMDATVFGQFSGIYYIGYGLAHLPLGVMLDRVGPKLIVPVCCLLCVLGLVPLLMDVVWVYPVVGRFLIGIGSSGAILGVFKIVRMVFPQEKFSQMLGISVTIGLLGAIYGSKPLHAFVEVYGWEACVMALILAGLIMAGGIYFAMPTLTDKEKVHGSLWQDTKKLLTNKYVVLISLFAGVMVAPLEGFADIWGTEYLVLAYDLTKSKAAFYPSLVFIGMSVGAPFLGSLSEKYKAYFSVVGVSGAVMFVLFALLLFVELPVWSMPVILFTVGVFCAYQIPAIAKATLFVSPQLMGLTTAFANMMIMFFGYVYHGLIGYSVKASHLMRDQAATAPYALEDFQLGLSVIPAGLLIGVLGFMWLAARSKQR